MISHVQIKLKEKLSVSYIKGYFYGFGWYFCLMRYQLIYDAEVSPNVPSICTPLDAMWWYFWHRGTCGTFSSVQCVVCDKEGFSRLCIVVLYVTRGQARAGMCPLHPLSPPSLTMVLPLAILPVFWYLELSKIYLHLFSSLLLTSIWVTTCFFLLLRRFDDILLDLKWQSVDICCRSTGFLIGAKLANVRIFFFSDGKV